MYNQKVKKSDDVLTVDEFREYVREKWFIDYDGYGHPAMKIKGEMLYESALTVYPSEVEKIPKEATHIIWFNK